MGKHVLSIGAGLSAALLSATLACAHDLWLVPAKFTVSPRATVAVALNTGDTFPVSESAVKPERIERASLVTSEGATPVPASRTAGTSTIIDVIAPRAAGGMIVEIVLKPVTTKQPRDGFDEFIKHEGLDHVAELLAREPSRREAESRAYAKYAKTLLRVGKGRKGATLFSKPLGHRLEIVPEADPFSLKAGGEFPVRLLFDGKPLALARLVVGSAAAATAKQSTMPGVRTDAGGCAALRLDGSTGLHYVHAVHMIPAEGGTDVQWETFWATLTFEPGH